MCILSLVWEDKDNFILTHNRDEDIRKEFQADFTLNHFHGESAYSPIDKVSGGTWIYYSRKYIACVLNGGTDFHMPGGHYRTSRGLLVLELLKHKNIEEYARCVNVENIEPFTFVLIDLIQGERKVFVWDGKEKQTIDIEENIFTWSSSTLYTADDKYMHNQYLKQKILENSTADFILDSHKQLRLKNHPYAKYVKTLMISQIKKQKGQIGSTYELVVP